MTAQGRRRGWGLAAAAMLMTLVATGCAQNAPLGSEAEGHETVDCRSEPSALLPNPEGRVDDSSVAVPGRVPDGFEAVAALRCSLELTLAPAPDREPVPLEFWSESGPPPKFETPENAAGGDAVWRVERFEGDLTRLLNALAAPDDVPSAELACTADMEIVPALWLESRSGEFVPVHYPRNGCGKTKPAVRDALAGLQVTIVEKLTWDAAGASPSIEPLDVGTVSTWHVSVEGQSAPPPDECAEDPAVELALASADLPSSHSSYSLVSGATADDAERIAECIKAGLTGGTITITPPKG